MAAECAWPLLGLEFPNTRFSAIHAFHLSCLLFFFLLCPSTSEPRVQSIADGHCPGALPTSKRRQASMRIAKKCEVWYHLVIFSTVCHVHPTDQGQPRIIELETPASGFKRLLPTENPSQTPRYQSRDKQPAYSAPRCFQSAPTVPVSMTSI